MSPEPPVLLARALGARVRAGEGPEIGFAPVEIHDPDDPIVGPLAPRTTVLHWHGDVFDLPDGAKRLASSARTELQAFRRTAEDRLVTPSMQGFQAFADLVKSHRRMA
jgi:GMP synthase-like glutamine amidotransferase